MVGILTDGGLKIVAKDETSGEYYVKTDHIRGALGNTVTVGGFNISNTAISSTNNNLILKGSGDITAKSGTIGGFGLNSVGL
jgi:hypothetical protein